MVDRDALCPINAFRGRPLFPSYLIPFTSELYKSLTTHNGNMFLNIKCKNKALRLMGISTTPCLKTDHFHECLGQNQACLGIILACYFSLG